MKTKKGSPLYRFKNQLRKDGYSFAQNVLNSKYFGVPQSRRRFVLIGTRLFKDIELPKPEKGKNKIITVRKAIGDYSIFPKIEMGYKDPSNFQHSVARLTKINLERVKATPKNGGTRITWACNKRLQLNCYKEHEGHYDVYGRLFWNKPAPTITTCFLYTSTGRYSHPEQNRALSLREGATLQSFPLSYKFHSSNQGTIATMIGNAVPPKLSEAIGLAIKRQWLNWNN